MKSWIREGQVVKAKYLDSYLVQGEIISSRVKYGGKVQHTLVLDHELSTHGVTRKSNEIILIDESEIIEVLKVFTVV